MSEQSNHINYTAADIEKYWKGNLSAAQMHAMEKAALDDPFLADAMEGYGRESSVVSRQSPMVSSESIAGRQNVGEDIADLKTRLQERISEGDKKAPVIAGAWWKIAASVIVVAGGVWLYQLSSSKNKDLALSKNENTVAEKEVAAAPAQPPVVSADSSATIKDALVANEHKTTLSSGGVIATDSMKDFIAATDKKDTTAWYKATVPRDVAASNTYTNERREVSMPSAMRAQLKTNQVDSVSVARLNKQAPAAPVTRQQFGDDLFTKNLKEEAKDKDKYDNNGYYKKSADDKEAELKKGVGDISRKIKNDTVSPFNANIINPNALPQKSVNLSLMNTFNGQVVTPANQPVAFATVKIPGQSIATQTDQNGIFSFKTMDTTLDVAVTNIGYQTQNYTLRNNYSIGDNRIVLQPDNRALNDVVVVGYGASKKRVTQKTKDVSVKILDAEPSVGWNEYNDYLEKNKRIADNLKDIHGDVVLNFDIDSKGLLKNFKIEKSLNDTLDEEAIRLVKYGPTWRLLKGKKTKVSVIVKF